MAKSKFKIVTPTYTGGNIYLFTGELTDGNFFVASTWNYDVSILTDNPLQVTKEHSMFPEYAMDSTEWFEEHLVTELEPTDAVKFFKSMLNWVCKYTPDGGYDISDMKYFIRELKELKGDWR